MKRKIACYYEAFLGFITSPIEHVVDCIIDMVAVGLIARKNAFEGTEPPFWLLVRDRSKPSVLYSSLVQLRNGTQKNDQMRANIMTYIYVLIQELSVSSRFIITGFRAVARALIGGGVNIHIFESCPTNFF